MVMHIQARIDNLEGLNIKTYSSRSDDLKVCQNPNCKKDYVISKKKSNQTKYCFICRKDKDCLKKLWVSTKKSEDNVPSRRIELRKKNQNKKSEIPRVIIQESTMKSVYRDYTCEKSITPKKQPNLRKLTKEERITRSFLLLPVYKRYELLEKLAKIKDKTEGFI